MNTFLHVLKVQILVEWHAESIEEKFSRIDSVVDGAEPFGWTEPKIMESAEQWHKASIITKMWFNPMIMNWTNFDKNNHGDGGHEVNRRRGSLIGVKSDIYSLLTVTSQLTRWSEKW